jgi:hypothetical protein
MISPTVLILFAVLLADAASAPIIEPTVPLQELADGYCWFHPRAAAIPGFGRDGRPRVVMTLQKHLRVSDYYSGLYMMVTEDLGTTWTRPEEIEPLAWVREPNDVVIAVADVTPGWHAISQKLLAIGAQVRYSKQGEQLEDKQRSNQTAYAIYDPVKNTWTRWAVLDLPGDAKFNFARNACSQWLVEPDGSLLLPLYYGRSDHEPYSVTVARCSFDGQTLRYLEHGDETRAQCRARAL